MRGIAFIGAGRMASAMVAGLLRDAVYPADEIACTCGEDPTGPELAQRTGITYEPSVQALIERAETIVLACKPQQFAALDPALAEYSKGRLIVSILAGTPLARLAVKFPYARNIVRAMPNTPGQIGQGVTGYASRDPLTSEDDALANRILGSLGLVVALSEDKLDAVTAVSGSGPAYVFEFTAALREAAEQAGLPPDVADILAKETVVGSALLMRESGTDPVELRKAVTSPGGTTQAALESLEADGFRAIVDRAVLAATRRSVELAKA